MADVTVRPYRPTDLEGCRTLWVELVQHHREIYQDPFGRYRDVQGFDARGGRPMEIQPGTLGPPF